MLRPLKTKLHFFWDTLYLQLQWVNYIALLLWTIPSRWPKWPTHCHCVPGNPGDDWTIVPKMLLFLLLRHLLNTSVASTGPGIKMARDRDIYWISIISTQKSSCSHYVSIKVQLGLEVSSSKPRPDLIYLWKFIKVFSTFELMDYLNILWDLFTPFMYNPPILLGTGSYFICP